MGVSKGLSGRELIVIVIVCVVTFFVNNEVVTPDIMEARNMVTAREMVYDGHWLIPTMNGELRLEKPPLPTWITAVAEIVSPFNLGLQRAMAGLAATMLVIYLGFFVRRILGMKPLLTCLILCTCYNVVLMGRTASWDIYTHAFMMGAIFHLSVMMTEGGSYKHAFWAGVMMGLSIMSKGPVSLYALFLPFVVSMAVVLRPGMRGRWLPLSLMVVIAIIVGCWWYAYVYFFHGDALAAVANKESGAWLSRNVRPWWYYWKFFLEAGVWALLLLSAIIIPLTSRKQRGDRRWLLPVLWLALSLVLLSLLPEKKSRYLLPIIIPSACVMGYYVSRCRRLLRVNIIAVAVAVAVLPVAAWVVLVSGGAVSIGRWVVLVVVCLFVLSCLVRSAIRGSGRGLVISVTILFLLSEIFFLPCVTTLVNNPEEHSIVRLSQDESTAALPLYYDVSGGMRIEVVYAARRCIRPMDVSDVDSVRNLLPCILLTHEPLGVLSEEFVSKIDTTFIDRFDNNRWAPGHRLYNEKMINYATMLVAK